MVRAFSLLSILFLLFCCDPYKNEFDYQYYPYAFSPLNGVVHSEELPYRSELCLNGRWSFMPVYSADASDLVRPSKYEWDSIRIKVPSPWNDLVTFPSYPKRWESARAGWMKREFAVPDNWTKKVVKLRFEAIAGANVVYVNDILVAENIDNIPCPFEIDVTSFLRKGRNEVVVGVAGTEKTFAGIWQDVHLVACPELSIDQVSVNADVKNNELIVVTRIHNYSSVARRVTSAVVVRSWKKDATNDINELPLPGGTLGAEVLNFSIAGTTSIGPGMFKEIVLKEKINGQLDYWTPDHANLYGITAELTSEDNLPIDKKFERFAWRQLTVQGSQVHLNGEKIILRGDAWRFKGIAQMTRRYAYAWFRMLKDANANAVLLDSQPYPAFYLDVADEIGICVLQQQDSTIDSTARFRISSLAWDGLKPLEFGFVDTTRAPTMRDGIFFPDFKESVPGVQPERLAPYTSTLNPGYDKRLPLYKPWPLFDSVKTANGRVNYLTSGFEGTDN